MGSRGRFPPTKVEELYFRMYSDKDIENISVMRVTSDVSFNELEHADPEGVYGLRMGPMSGREIDLCKTCGLNSMRCMGHCGHIDLPLPVFNPNFYDILKQFLEKVCFHCHRFQAKAVNVLQLIYEVRLARAGYGKEALEIGDITSRIINGSWDEAIEVSAGPGDGKDRLDINVLKALKRGLEKYYKKVIKEGNSTRSSVTTASNSSVNAIYQQAVRRFFSNSSNVGKVKCCFCKAPMLRLRVQNSRFLIVNRGRKKNEDDKEDEEVEESAIGNTQSYITPDQARSCLRNCWTKDKELLSHLYPILACSDHEYPTDLFFMQKILVIPPKYRPCNFQDGMMVEHEMSTLLKNIVKYSKCLFFLISVLNKTMEDIPEALTYILSEVPGKTNQEKMQNVWYQVQGNVDNILDAKLNNMVKITTKGIKQVIEKKEGLFRNNLMGKRVNFSARSVAAPDPNLAVDEVGVPRDFAIRLTYPVPVTSWNSEELRNLVLNGPAIYPGALIVEDEEGRKTLLKENDFNQRQGVAKKLLTPTESHVRKVHASKIVYRHLKDGDFVLMNRQPTLHRPSIQAHRARVMNKERVLRMPYANCKAYNADFDGDELNLHFPQNEMARSEAFHLVTTHNQYLTPKDGSPLAGLIQDCVVSSVMVTMRGTYFNKEDYQQLVFSGLVDQMSHIRTQAPSILKPLQLWSGKQVISTILQNIIPSNKAKPTFTFRTNVKHEMWQKVAPREWRGGGTPEKRKESMTESEFIMRDGDLLCGVIDKCAIGSTSHGLIHTCYDLYGGAVATGVLTAINRLCTYYLQWVGHTIGAKEFVTPKVVSSKRRKALNVLVETCAKEVAPKLGVPLEKLQDHFEAAHVTNNEKEMAAIDAAYTSVLGPVTSQVTAENERGLYRRGLDNNMKMMVDTGAKGSKVNMNQMASLFGSLAIDGKRMPQSITGKTLPSFKPYDINPRAGGYIPKRFMTGIDPQSYFFLCIVGRDSLQHTAVKTASSGYVQRCLIKHLEGIQVMYDMTVRNSDGLVLQFDFGEDGQDVSKVPFLKEPRALDILVDNYSRLLDPKALAATSSRGENEEAKKYKEKIKKWQKKNKSNRGDRRSGFLHFCHKTSHKVEESNFCPKTGRSLKALKLEGMWRDLSEEEKLKHAKKTGRCPDPVASKFSASSTLGVVSEALDDLIDNYYNNFYKKRTKSEQYLSKDQLRETIHMKALTSRVDPGEAVGAICAQALGEPLTQMTLNTFHFAGKDELNVTLGVPRMIEILRTGTPHISTPIMEVPFRSHISKAQAEAMKMKLSQVPLSKVLNRMDVTVSLELNQSKRLLRRVKVCFHFLPQREYRHTYAVKPRQIIDYVYKHYISQVLLAGIKKAYGRSKPKLVDTGNEGKETENDSRDVVDDEEFGLSRKGAPQAKEEEANSESEDEVEDNEADAATAARQKRANEQDYSEDEEEEEEKDQAMSEDEGLGEEKLESADEREEQEDGLSKPKVYSKNPLTENEVSKMKNYVLSLDRWIVDFTLDAKNYSSCEVTLMLPTAQGKMDIATVVRKTTEKALVHHVSNIKRAFVVEKDNGLLLRTEGVNVQKMFEYEHILDINRLYTNDIHMVAHMYGIEAAQRSIIREIQSVHSAYDIKVDFRHLSLLADYFTCEGMYKACSRHHITSCISPIQKMSYETSTQFLKKAILSNESDHMCSPSANIAVGQTVKVGTNIMHIMPILKL
ncbi:RNA polymerase I subunit RpI1 [Oratosquilla oratoria]|uniref:RNA polymerase I subunit RpI1 n=1 Tax=Oratosquilla oratoria TaxID=337810 RepID=UPI003F760356